MTPGGDGSTYRMLFSGWRRMPGHVATKHRRRVVDASRLVLAAVVLAGIGAAMTAAAWTDGAQFGATAGASTFDVQGRFAVDAEWEDVGLPGSPDTFEPGFEIVIPPVTDVLPDHSYAGDVFLCNAGDVDGRITAATLEELTTSAAGVPIIDSRIVLDSSIEVEGIDVGTIIAANSCEPATVPDPANDLHGIIHFTTESDFTGLYGSTSQIIIRIWVNSEP
jgi:hypothetical protein